MKLDEVYEKIGEFGRYQVLLCSVLFLALGWPSPAVTIVYTAIRLDHWCSLPGYQDESAGLDGSSGKQAWIPYDNATGTYDKCHSYDYGNGSEAVTGNQTVPCSSWEYDYSQYGPSVVSKYDLVCDREWLIALLKTSYQVGVLIGSFITGFISDRYGRQRTFFIVHVLLLGSWFLGIFSPNYTFYAISRLLVGILRISFYMTGFLMCMELVGPKYRFLAGSLANVAFGIGYILISLLAWAFKDSFKFELAIVCPAILFLLFYFVLPESPRWLLAVGREEEAMDILRKIGRLNGRPLPDNMDTLTVEKNESNKRGTLLDVFRSIKLRRRFYIVAFHWFVLVLIYYTLLLGSQTLLPGNLYVNQLAMACIDILGTFIAIGLSAWPRMGRRWTAGLSTILVGVFGFITIPMVIYGYDTATTVLALSGKMFVTISFAAIYAYTVELFPTEVRHASLGACSTMGRISSLLSAVLGDQLGALWSPLPYVVFGILGTCSGLLDLLLPETLGEKLCETVKEEEAKCQPRKEEKPSCVPLVTLHDCEQDSNLNLETKTVKLRV